jgi:hypothetical protein
MTHYSPQPVLMIPLRRCGSHALRLRLNFSAEFYAPYPLHITDFMPLLPKYGDLHDDRHYFQLVIDLVGLQNATMVKWPHIALDPVSIFEAVQKQPRSIHTLMWEMLLQAGKQQQARVVMDKSLDSVFFAEDMLAVQPQLRFLNVARDPRAQISSMNRAIIYDFDTLLNTQRWVRAYQAAKDLQAKYPQQVLTIRFEDFISDQDCTLRQICAFFGIDFMPAMLDIANSDEAREISGLSALWQTNVYPPVKANVDKFKQHLSLDEIELIETLTGEFMDLYGYEKITSASAQMTDIDIQAAQERSEINRKQAWARLQQDNMRDYLLRRFRNEYLANLARRLDMENQ